MKELPGGDGGDGRWLGAGEGLLGHGDAETLGRAGEAGTPERATGKVREVSGSQRPSVPGPRTLIDLPHGGYRKLIAWRKSEVVYQGTVVFCRRFLPARGDRTVDQMVQAARSCKQNIAEGSASAGTSKEMSPVSSNPHPMWKRSSK